MPTTSANRINRTHPARAKRGPRAARRNQSALSSKKPRNSQLVRQIFAQTRTPAFKKYLTDLLVELCSIDTTPNPDVGKMRDAEDRCFRILERELGSLDHSGARLERKAINPGIKSHRNFSLLHFTKTDSLPGGLTLEEVYAGRCNLIYCVPGKHSRDEGTSIALNAHLDVVAPYFAPHARSGAVYGRGACDDKGPVVGIVAGFKVLSAVMAKTGLAWNKNVVGMFVVEEETGGNGSLSLAVDRELKTLYDSVLVSECTGLKLHPANRGAVWYRAEISPHPGVSAFEMFAFINEEMEKEGAAIRAESRHDLFPQRPVQTCHGIIGPFGEHPSRICGKVTFSIIFQSPPNGIVSALVEDCMEAGLAAYVGTYGDKTKVPDPATGKPMVARHYHLSKRDNRFIVDVFGAPGHMGSIRERDGAITKAAFLVRSLVFSKDRLERAAGKTTLELGAESSAAGHFLVLEGGQGFVPTHPITEIMGRLERAVQNGAQAYLRRTGRAESQKDIVKITYEKLHNVAFDGDPKSPGVTRALRAARICGLPNDEPVLGWTVSCDARLFATEYPGMPVLTFGPGRLVHAHSDHEQIDIDEIRAAAEFLAVFLLLQTGTVQDL